MNIGSENAAIRIAPTPKDSVRNARTRSTTSGLVAVAFVVFLLVLVYYKVPALIGKALDDRAEGIRRELVAAPRTVNGSRTPDFWA